MRPEEIWTADVADLAFAVRSGRVTATAVVEACLQQYRRWEPVIHAFAHIDPDSALHAAKEIDQGLANGGPAGLLIGVPIGVKDVFDTVGANTEFGSPIFKGRRPLRSASTVEALQHQGGIIFGKTVTAELAYFSPGPTRNPWNSAKTPGGSSMGSAAAVAAGVIPASIGTQTNGSVIRPAAFCGVVGFKPSSGKIPTDGVLTFSRTLDHVGLFARSVRGVALLLRAIQRGPDEEVAPSLTSRGLGPRLAVVRTRDWDLADISMKESFDGILAALSRAGATVETPEFPAELDDSLTVLRVIMAVEGRRFIGPLVMAQSQLLSSAFADLMKDGSEIDEANYRAALATRQRLITQYQAWSKPYDAVATIPAVGEAPPAQTTGDPRFCTRWSLVGAPAISLPIGFGATGMPLGMQLVGIPAKDSDLLHVAAWVESNLPRLGLVPELSRLRSAR